MYVKAFAHKSDDSLSLFIILYFGLASEYMMNDLRRASGYCHLSVDILKRLRTMYTKYFFT